MDKFLDCSFAQFRVKYIVWTIAMAYFSILGKEEKNEDGDILAEAEKMYTNLFQFQHTISYNNMFYKSSLILNTVIYPFNPDDIKKRIFF